MSKPAITADELSAYAANVRRENLKNQMILSAMLRLCEQTGEMDADELGGFACEIEALLEVLHDRLADFAGHLSCLNVAEGVNDAES